MKKSIILTIALGAVMTVGVAACSGSSKSSEAESDTLEIVDDIPVAERDSLAKIFDDTTRKSEVATDTTYAVTGSGLKYMILKEGSGKQPTSTSSVTVHYTGQLTTGYVFDSSITRGEPATFPLNRVIPGWTEGLQLMKEGGEAVFYIPGNLAYGPNGMPQAGIGPNEDLIFTVQLISVE